MNNELSLISPKVLEKAESILNQIKASQNILLHCHVGPDPDSVGSVLAMKEVLENMGKNVTAISGDNKLSDSLLSLPKADSIEIKKFAEVDLSKFDLYIILDTAAPQMISMINEPKFPLSIKTIIIDHHASNVGFADINLIDPDSRATAFTLYELFKVWNVEISHDIAVNLFMGIYTDTGGFSYSGVDHRCISACGELARIAPDFTKYISDISNNESAGYITFISQALTNIDIIENGRLVISSVSNEFIRKNNIPNDATSGHSVSTILKKIKGWGVIVTMIEIEPNLIKVGLRTRDESIDVSRIAAKVGGGGHRLASGVVMRMGLEEAKKKIIEAVF
jgi:phosphoesterase RecJ-like protein